MAGEGQAAAATPGAQVQGRDRLDTGRATADDAAP
jgi:hypothetical protein